jgi:anti-sigma B factor antagonist
MTCNAALASAFDVSSVVSARTTPVDNATSIGDCDIDTLHHDMTITAGTTGPASVTVVGEVDASNADRLRLTILDAANQTGAKLEVDLAAVTFIDSSGLRAIADASRGLEKSGTRLVLSNLPRQVLRLLAITDIGTDLEVIQ